MPSPPGSGGSCFFLHPLNTSARQAAATTGRPLAWGAHPKAPAWPCPAAVAALSLVGLTEQWRPQWCPPSQIGQGFLGALQSQNRWCSRPLGVRGEWVTGWTLGFFVSGNGPRSVVALEAKSCPSLGTSKQRPCPHLQPCSPSPGGARPDPPVHPPQEHGVGLPGGGQERGPGAGPRRRAYPCEQPPELHQLPALLPFGQVVQVKVLETPLHMCAPVHQGHPGTQHPRTRYPTWH